MASRISSNLSNSSAPTTDEMSERCAVKNLPGLAKLGFRKPNVEIVRGDLDRRHVGKGVARDLAKNQVVEPDIGQDDGRSEFRLS